MNIVVKMRDGTEQRFEERGRPGGSWCNSFKCVDGWVIIKDEWEATTAIPQELVLRVEQEAPRGRW